MKFKGTLASIIAVVAFHSIVIAVDAQTNAARSERFIRGSGTDPTFQSFVIPLDFQKGVQLDNIGGFITNLYAVNPWFLNYYHYDATNPASATNLSLRIPFRNPIAAFGERLGGSPLYINQPYEFGLYAGYPGDQFYPNSVHIWVYARSNSALMTNVDISIPDVFDTGQFPLIVDESFTTTVTLTNYALQTILSSHPFQRWGTFLPEPVILRHTALSSVATNFFYVVEYAGYTDFGGEPMVVNSINFDAWSKMYVMEFTPRPLGRSMFLDQPHFSGTPLPPEYQDKPLQELTNLLVTLPSLSLTPSNYLTLNHSPELRRHPMLDQFVTDMRHDPLALANYVLNEVELTDALDYDTNRNAQPTINLGGVNRSALATFQEGQGSPMEQCALLVYLLRQAGTPATYVFATNNGMKMLDTELSKLLRFQVKGAVSQRGLTNLPTMIGVNYPWVAAYIGTNWVHVFPWLKDTEIIEGLDLYDYMPTNYNTGHKWLAKYVAGDTNIMSLSTSDQPMDLFPKFIQRELNNRFPGISLDDIGVKIRNRRNLYSRWTDFPKPFALSTTPIVKESLTNDLSLFNTIQIRVYSEANTNKAIDTGELRIADLHNRKLQLRFWRVANSNLHDMVLSLDPYHSGISNFTTFGGNPTNRLVQTNRLNSTDDNIGYQVIHRRVRTLSPSYSAPVPNSNIWEFLYFEQGTETKFGLTYDKTETFRKGDLVTFCLDVGRVSPKMLRTHAETIWQHNQTATNAALQNPDVYQGTVAYLAGMSYWEYFRRFKDLNSRLHKIQMIANYGYGFSLLRPQRTGSGVLVSNGVVNLIEPVLHIPQNGGSDVFNGTLRPDSGRDSFSAHWNWFLVDAAQGSAAEHGILESFYNTNAVSTVKLLQVEGSDRVEMHFHNYEAKGELVFGTKKLKNHDKGIWNSITNFFNEGVYSDLYKQVLMTRGAKTVGSYEGVGAFLIGVKEYQALISGMINGGNSYQFPVGTLSSVNAPNITLSFNPDGAISQYSFVSSPINSGNQLVTGGATTWEQQDYYNAISGNQVPLDPTLLLAAAQANQGIGNSGGNSATGYRDLYNLGLSSTYLTNPIDWEAYVADPVNVMTGEFYVDQTDLTLPGPMPLSLRRNYSSLNLADNSFGFAWKINYVPYLGSSTNEDILYASDPEGTTVAYQRTSTNAIVWLPTTARNPLLNNSAAGIGSIANRFNGRIDRTTVSGTNIYTLRTPDGHTRIFIERSFPIGASFPRLRPYLAKWQDDRGNCFAFEYGEDSAKPDYGEVRRIQSSNGSFLGFYYDVYGHIIEAYTGDGRRLYYEYDRFGDLVKVTRPDATEISYEYQRLNFVTNSVTNAYSTHLLVTESKPDGRVLKNQYDSKRRVTNQLATVGVDLNPIRNATFTYANNFNITNGFTNLLTGFTVITDVNNNTNRYDYANSLITNIVDQLGQKIEQQWYADTASAPGFPRSLWKRKDKRGLWTEFKYDASGNATNTVTSGDLLGDGTTVFATNNVVYDARNLPVETTDSVGNKTRTSYSAAFPFLPEQVIRFAGSTAISTNLLVYYNVTNTVVFGGTTVTNTAFGLLQQQTRAYGTPEAATILWFHDGRGFPTQQVQFTGTSDPAVTNHLFYNDRNELVERTDGAGRKTRFAYDGFGRPITREVYESGSAVPLSWEYSYLNDNGELVWSDGPRFAPEDYTWADYDGAGRKVQQIQWRSRAKTDGDGVEAEPGYNLYATSFYEYDAFGNLTKATDPRGNYRRLDYDGIGQLVRERFFDGNTGAALATNGYAHEPGGKVTRATNALGGITETLYTKAGQPFWRRNPNGSTNGWRYYLDGRVRREIQGNGAYWETTHDDANRRVTRVFYSAANTALATNVSEFDLRGNVVRQVDAEGFSFTNSVDALGRLKFSVGPAIQSTNPPGIPNPGPPPPPIQQASTNYYDAAGMVFTNVNALGEKTITFSDALGRTTRVEIRNAANTLVRESTTSFAANHHSATTTNGSGPTAIASTMFTDTAGGNVLTVAYPASGVRHFTRRELDIAGNLAAEIRGSMTNSALVEWTRTTYQQDALNRVVTQTDRDSAQTTFAYDAIGNVTNRGMPGGLSWRARYNNASQVLEEFNLGTGGVATRTNTYTYYSSASAFAGLLQTRTDGRGVACTYTYDDWLRSATNSHSGAPAEHNLTTAFGYNARGLLTSITESFASTNTGPATTITRSYDAYASLKSESIAIGNVMFASAVQSWDSAGRRSGLGYGTFGYSFAWRPDGALGVVSGPTGGGAYFYDTAGLLTNRSVGARVAAIESRDGVGRPLSVNTTISGQSQLYETLTWTGDGLLSTHTLARGDDFTDSRAYFYASLSRRLIEERLNLNAAARWTNTFAYDGGQAAGAGVLTRNDQASGSGNVWSGARDNFLRLNTETNARSVRPATGRANGPATINGYLDDKPVSISVVGTQALTWHASVELTPGTHQLRVSALHPSRLYQAWATNWFTNNVANETVADVYDGAGFITQRIWKHPSGATNRTQTLTWDARGRLLKVVERDTTQSGRNWSAVYDTFGRRLRSTEIIVTNNVAVTSHPIVVDHYFDPQVEFLELGVSESGRTTWKLLGPDADGTYGGQNGLGGFDAIIPGVDLFCPTVSDARGNQLAVYDQTHGGLTWVSGRVTGYGAVPGYQPLALGSSGDLVTKSAWRNRAMEAIGLIWLGGRYYDPVAARFASADPLDDPGNPAGYSFASGDPINYFDADGRLGNNPQPHYNGPVMTPTDPSRYVVGDDGQVYVSAVAAGFADQMFNNLVLGLFNPEPFYVREQRLWSDQPSAEHRYYDALSAGAHQAVGSPLAQSGFYNPNSSGGQLGEILGDTTSFALAIEGGRIRPNPASVSVSSAVEQPMITVLGSGRDVAAYANRPGFNVLNMDSLPPAEWPRQNALWLNEAIVRGDDVWLVTDPIRHQQLLNELPSRPQSFYLNLELPMLQQYNGVNVVPHYATSPAGKASTR
jgi:RHS repeat-associated protein